MIYHLKALHRLNPDIETLSSYDHPSGCYNRFKIILFFHSRSVINRFSGPSLLASILAGLAGPLLLRAIRHPRPLFWHPELESLALTGVLIGPSSGISLGSVITKISESHSIDK